MTGVAAGYTVVAPGPPALQGVAPVDHSLAGDAEVPQAVVLFLHPRVGHGCHPRPLLGQAQVVGAVSGGAGGLDVRAGAGRLDRL